MYIYASCSISHAQFKSQLLKYVAMYSNIGTYSLEVVVETTRYLVRTYSYSIYFVDEFTVQFTVNYIPKM